MAETRVSIVLPVLNEEADIAECLARIRAQSHAPIEVLIADGGSTDRSCDVVAEVAKTDQRARICLLRNPRRLQSAGLNVALAASTGEVVVRLDARSFVDPDYVGRCVEVLQRTGAAVVGGQMVPRFGRTPTARAIAAANSAWWGAGPARFHGHGAEGPAETVYLGAFRREWLEAVGGWAEDVGVNEDFELNHRIRTAGGVVWFDPGLRVEYQPRTSLSGVARQYFRYGRSKASVLRRHPSSLRLRQLAPALLFPSALLALLGGPLSRLGGAAVAAHSGAVVAAATRELGANRESIRASSVAVVMHWAWTAGLWVGLVRPFPAAEPSQ